MQDNHKKYPKFCVYWIGPFIPFVFTADVETMKIFLHQSGGIPLCVCARTSKKLFINIKIVL